MSEQPNSLSLITFQNKSSGRIASSSKSPADRKYFERVQPTFSVPSAGTKLEFVDNSDPQKDVLVRKKAREWVHRNREITRRKRGVQSGNGKTHEIEFQQQWDLISKKSTSLPDPSSGRIDPFDMLPNVGRRVDHIIEFFLTQCPEEVPCSDDTYAWRSKAVAQVPSRANTVLGTMANERLSFILWLHATTVIRDGMAGNLGTEECRYYYKLALQAMREETRSRRVEDYSDAFLASLGCFAACANFAGDYQAAIVHRDAMLKALIVKGGGDLLKGVQSTKQWTQKGMAWCEIHVAAQIPEIPKLPFNPPAPPKDHTIPYSITLEAERLANVTLAHLPNLTIAYPGLLSQLHLLGLLQQSSKSVAKPQKYPSQWSPHDIKTSPHAISPLYCAEYTILQLLSQQREDAKANGFTAVEIVLTDALHCFFWPALRGLPCEMKMCDLFVARLKKALCTLNEDSDVTEEQEKKVSPPPSTASSSTPGLTSDDSTPTPPDFDVILPPSSPTLRHTNDFLIIWALFVGTLVSSVGDRPEHGWFKEQLLGQVLVKNARAIKSKDDLARVLRIFPWTDAFCGVGIEKVGIPF